jgi:hypothetical protein
MKMQRDFDDYAEFVRSMEAQGWKRRQLSIDELNTTMVSTSSVAAGAASGTVATITCPAGQIITTMGTQQVPAGADRDSAHALVLRLAGTDDTELDLTKKIRISKEGPEEDTVSLVRDFYAMFTLTRQGGSTPVYRGDNEIYRWRRGIVLYGNEKLKIEVYNPDIAIDSSYVKLTMDIDLWTYRA